MEGLVEGKNLNLTAVEKKKKMTLKKKIKNNIYKQQNGSKFVGYLRIMVQLLCFIECLGLPRIANYWSDNPE